MSAQVITRVEELLPLAGEWNELLRSSPADSIFLTWEWVSAWLEVVRPAARLLVVAVRDEGGQLTGVAPFYRTRMRLMKVLPYGCLRVLGDRDSGAEYPDIIIRAGHEQTVLPRIAEALHEQRRAWDCLWVPQMAGWTGASRRFRALCGGSASGRVNERPVDFGSVELPRSHEAYLSMLSGNARSNLRRGAKRVNESAKSVNMVRCERPDQLAGMLSALFDLHTRRWQAVGEPGCFQAGGPMRRFYERFAPLALRCGWLRLAALELDGVTRAVQFGYAYAGRFYQLQEGYDPAAPEGVGNVLRESVFRQCIAEGLREYDFLGEFSEHKRRWGAQQRVGIDLLIGRGGWKSAGLFTRPVWPTGRFLREELPLAKAEFAASGN
jgi:CelD/BcsL family acetyltransferase involved in cellulose biosynthesis